MENFRKLGLNEPILKAIEEHKFEKPSEIQEKAIPLILAGKDIIAGSATGSGKTLAFGAGILQQTEAGKGIQALILTPTRELAEQNCKALRQFSKYKPLHIASVYGGVSIMPQISDMREAEIVIGTPGRILDHIERRTIDFSHLRTLVLDEADRMLDMGFIDDVRKIINSVPIRRQTLLFSATISPDIAHLASKYMKTPVEISAENYVDPKKLTQIYYDVSTDMKFSTLVHLLKKEHPGLIMVFCNTRRNVDFVANNLNSLGINALGIHGGYSQDKRTKVLHDFHTRQALILVCTDVAARGLDIKGVSHVYNYELPKDSKEYIHRIGRTARAGKEGKAVSLLSSPDFDNFTHILKNPDLDIKNEDLPQIEKVRPQWFERPREGRFGGFRSHRNSNRPSHGFGRNRMARGRDDRRHGGHSGNRGRDGNRSDSRGRSWGRR